MYQSAYLISTFNNVVKNIYLLYIIFYGYCHVFRVSCRCYGGVLGSDESPRTKWRALGRRAWMGVPEQPIFLKLDQCQLHEIFWTARQSSQVVNWVKTKPRLAGNQIPFRGTRFGFTSVGRYPTSITDTYTKPNLVPLKGI